MNIKEVMANSHRILDELNNHTLDVLARAELGAQRSLRGMTGYLALQASIAEDEEDLVYIADVLHDLAADVPGMLENGYELGQLQSMTLEPVFSPHGKSSTRKPRKVVWQPRPLVLQALLSIFEDCDKRNDGQ